ncbi:peptidoglycan bridge formation glycyltransferase FemA/FemB family protein [Aquicoccus sp. SCR17]|nr:peptidoglycan bridge formation glycyltransferase FemA/FemB family protein [Carideicomes alvinocaridis]
MPGDISLKNVTETEWPQISGNFEDLNFEQTITYGNAAAERIGAKVRFVVAERADEIMAAACIRIKYVPGLRRGIAWIASGPLLVSRSGYFPSEKEISAILAAFRKKICVEEGHILRLRPAALPGWDIESFEAAASAAGFIPASRGPAYRTVAVDLAPDEGALMKGLHGKWRNLLRASQKSGLELESGPISKLQGRFHALYTEVQEKKGFSPEIPPDFYYQLEGCDFEHEVLIARKDGVDLAGITIGRTGTSSVYLFGATASQGRSVNAGYFLIWNGILESRSKGSSWFDLGGIDEANNPDVTRFKRRTGGQEVSAPGPFESRPSGLGQRAIRFSEELFGYNKRLTKALTRH